MIRRRRRNNNKYKNREESLWRRLITSISTILPRRKWSKSILRDSLRLLNSREFNKYYSNSSKRNCLFSLIFRWKIWMKRVSFWRRKSGFYRIRRCRNTRKLISYSKYCRRSKKLRSSIKRNSRFIYSSSRFRNNKFNKNNNSNSSKHK